MLSRSKQLQGGVVYGGCLHSKPPYLQWDPHAVCFACTTIPNMETAMTDFVRGGVPTCRYCRHIPSTVRKHWIDSVRDCKGLVPWTGETMGFRKVHGDVARLVMQASPPSDSPRAGCSDLPSRRTVASSQLAPQGASYFSQAHGYLATSSGEPTPRGVGHGSGHDGETRASGSHASPLPPRGIADRSKGSTVAAEPFPLNFAMDNPDDPWGSGAPVAVSEGKFIGEEDEKEDRESRDDWRWAANPPSAEAPQGATSIFEGVLRRAISSGCYKTLAVDQPSLPMGSLSTGRLEPNSKFVPAYPPVEQWFKLAERSPSLEPYDEVVKRGGVIIPVAVEGLCHEEWRLPLAEDCLKPEGWEGRMYEEYSSLPLFAHYTGDTMLRMAWLSNLRAVNYLSCVGMINSYLKGLSDPTNLELHGEALMAAGVDLESLRIGMELPGVRDFLSELSQACEALGVMVLNASLSLGRGCAAATLGRRKLWIDGLGYDMRGVERFAECSTAGNTSLCGFFPAAIKEMEREQTERDSVTKVLAPFRKSTPPATSPSVAGRSKSGFIAANSAKLQLAWSKGIPVPGRGYGGGGGNGTTKRKQPEAQRPSRGMVSDPGSPAAKRAMKQ